MHGFESVVGGRDGALDHGHSGLGAGRRILRGIVQQGVEALAGFGGLHFQSLVEFAGSVAGNVIQMAAVGSSLFGQRLEQAGLQSQQFLGVLTLSTAWVCWAASVKAAREAVTFSSTSFSTPSKALLVRPNSVSKWAFVRSGFGQGSGS